jgi:hypothetical protein
MVAELRETAGLDDDRVGAGTEANGNLHDVA